jgi:hypothetical protein
MNKYKILLLIANHTSNNIKYNVSLSNISNIKNFVEKIVIIDSKDENYAQLLYNDLKKCDKIMHYFFINNDNYYDFGKWIYALKKVDLNNYDYILFLNDSIIMTEEIKNYFHYINNLMSEDIDLYAYNDSTQIKYHYQSYLFLLKSKNIDKFIDFFESKKKFINDLKSLIENIELNMTQIYDNHDVFLKIGEEYNQSRNLYWENEELYKYLMSKNIFALIKLKKIYDIQNEYRLDIYDENIEDFDYDFYRNYYELQELNDKEILDHFLKTGQFEGYKHKKDFKTLLPKYYREKLEKLGLLYFFDVPEDFDIYYYKKNNIELINYSYIDCIKHYVYHGFYEGRTYNKNDDKNTYLNNIYINLLSKINDKELEYIIQNDFNLYTYMLLNNYLDKHGYLGVMQKYINNDINADNSFNKNQLKEIMLTFDIDLYKKINENVNNLDHHHILQYYINNELNLKKLYKMPTDFDYNIYRRLYKDIAHFSNNEIDMHYLKHGIFEGRIYKVPDDFDGDIYKSIYKELEKLNRKELEEHYLFKGMKENRIYKIPSDFNSTFYKNIYKDLEKFNDTQLKEHYINHGIKENRQYKMPDDFNYELYKKLYSDISNFSNNDIDKHYLNHGIFEGRIYKLPYDFDVDFYRGLYEDVSKLNDKEVKKHYLFKGIKEYRLYKFPDDFDPITYKNLNNDLADLNNEELKNHYLKCGIKEKRVYKKELNVNSTTKKEDKKEKKIKENSKLPDDFDPIIYKNLNSDLVHLNNEELINHYINYGINEKRIYKSKLPKDFDAKKYKKLNPDLVHLNKKELIEHYLNYGINEKRIYK